MPFEGPTSGLQITVSNAEELSQAYELLSGTPGGGDILLTSDAEGIALELTAGGNQPVHITSADPNAPVTVSRIATKDVENVGFSALKVDSTSVDRPDWQGDLNINDSLNIEIANVQFSSTATEQYDPANPETSLAESLGMVRDSHGVEFIDNSISGYYQGLTLLESTDLEVRGNEFTAMQGDGIRMAGVQDVLIADNHMHDFHGTVQSFNHNDMIQMWERGAEIVSDNVTITGNILDAGAGSGYQGILVGQSGDPSFGDLDYIYTDIEISNNLIHTGSSHGITVEGADGVDVYDNTLLWNEDALLVTTSGADGVSRVPVIRLTEVINGGVTNNIAGGYAIDDAVAIDNQTIDYTDPMSPDFVGHHFIAATEGGAASLTDLTLRPDSDWVGKGSELTSPVTSSEAGVQPVFTVAESHSDLNVLLLDASFSVDESGFVDPETHVFRWFFEDGTVREGQDVVHSFNASGAQNVTLEIHGSEGLVGTSSRVLDVADNTFLSLDFENGLIDGSAYGTDITFEGDLVDGETGQGFRIGGEDQIEVLRENEHFLGLHSFGLSLDMQLVGDAEGRFIHFNGVMSAEVDEDGIVSFSLTTNEGTFVVDSGDVSLHDSQFHTIAIGFSDEAGELVLTIDGTVVGETEATGQTAPTTQHGFIIGSNFRAAPDAIVDNVFFGVVPAKAGVPIITTSGEQVKWVEDGALILPQAIVQDQPEPEVAPEVASQPEPEDTLVPELGDAPEPPREDTSDFPMPLEDAPIERPAEGGDSTPSEAQDPEPPLDIGVLEQGDVGSDVVLPAQEDEASDVVQDLDPSTLPQEEESVPEPESPTDSVAETDTQGPLTTPGSDAEPEAASGFGTDNAATDIPVITPSQILSQTSPMSDQDLSSLWLSQDSTDAFMADYGGFEGDDAPADDDNVMQIA